MENDLGKRINFVDKSQAIKAIAHGDDCTPIIIDFDETLLLRNSTAEYINGLRPRLLAFLLISIIKVIKPWMCLPKPFRGEQIRDWFLVMIPTILLPWTRILWQKKGAKLAQAYGNLELIEAVKQNPDSTIIIASLGFNFVIDPILRHLPVRYNALIGCRFWQGASDRAQGKLSMIQSALSEAEIKSAIVVTDSEDDLPLLQVVPHPYLVVWSLAQYIDPFRDFWFYVLIKKLKKN